MPSAASSQVVVDQRGYIFTLPSLGVPDISGEYVTITGAIGVKEQALPLILNKSSSTATPPLRTPASEAKILDFEFQGALWLLPLVTPRGSHDSPPEIFSVRVQRLPLSATPDASRQKLPDDSKWICLTPPEGMTAYLEDLAARAQPEANKTQTQPPPSSSPRTTFGAAPVSSRQSTNTSASNANVTIDSRIYEEESSKWYQMAGETLEESWCHSMLLKTVSDAQRAGLPHDPHSLTIVLREHPAWNNDVRSLDYAIARVGEDERQEFEEQRWTPLPPEAFKPGTERRLVNMARGWVGKRPFGEDEWPPGGSRLR